ERMTVLVRAIDSQEIQLALRPSPTTGLTLAATVQAKLKDVQERIRTSKKIMDAARFNLNRLRYGIELERRSILLYKVILGVALLFTVLFFWFLYYSRTRAIIIIAASPPQPIPPSIVITSENPFESDFNQVHLHQQQREDSGGEADRFVVTASTFITDGPP
ncbi:hypothetical protein BGZ65_000430, partial [Modicella reniformis]